MANPPPKYVARIARVREIALHGVADLDPWRDLFRDMQVQPALKDGKAQLLLTAVAARWMGVRFRELSIALRVDGESTDGQRDGLYLPLAFNSSRFFAFCERKFFHTPYVRAQVQVDTGPPPSFSVISTNFGSLSAAMSVDPRYPAATVEECWEGPIYLSTEPRRPDQQRWFRAMLAGQTESYPFTAGDTFQITPPSNNSILARIQESQFSPQRWTIRQNATHARSKTVVIHE